MAAEYDFRKILIRRVNHNFLYSRIVSKGAITTEKMAEEISWASILTLADLLAALIKKA